MARYYSGPSTEAYLTRHCGGPPSPKGEGEGEQPSLTFPFRGRGTARRRWMRLGLEQ